LQDDDDQFAYEGIFDKKESNKNSAKFDRNKIELSRLINGFNNSRMTDEDK